MAISEHIFWSSTNLESATFDDKTGHVTVIFKRGDPYGGDIDKRIWEEFMTAPSPGAFVKTMGLERE